MKKNTILFSCLVSLLPVAGFSQCCNVFASNGTAVTTSEGSCVTLTYATTDCLTASLAGASAADSDNDGVTDDMDKCPTVKGTIENKGCPLVSSEVWTLFYTEFRDVKFANNSDSLTPVSFSKLNNVAALMQANNDYTLKVSGYTDSVGTNQSNRTLSEKRATAVKNYLVSKGVPENKIMLAAYGEKFPKAPNETAGGRSQNRRVEFDLFY